MPDIQTILSSKKLRIEAGRQSLLNFAMIYLAEYVKFPYANFHRYLEEDLYDDEEKRILAMMFRESAKTVLCGLVYPLWCICYKKRHFIIYGSDEENAAASNMANLIYQLQANTLIANDFGTLYFEPRGIYKTTKKKTVKDFVTTNNIRVYARAVGQKVRGKLHNSHRPDLFLGDDLESIRNTNTKESRDKIDKWIHSEVLPALDQAYGKAVIMANLLNEDAVAQRLANKPEVWKVHRVPVQKDGKFAWPARWVQTKEEAKKVNAKRNRDQWVVSVEEVKEDKGSLIFNQEYMLKPIRDEDQIIFPNHCHLYDTKFKWTDEKRFKVVMAVDPAISEKQKADYTAIAVFLLDKITNQAYCLDFVNKRMSFQQIKDQINKLWKYWQPQAVLVEDVAAQNWLIQDLRNEYQMRVIGVKRRADKRSRLVSVSYLFEQGKVHFKANQEIIIDQLVNFGSMAHDDLVDAVIDCLQYLYRRGKTKLKKSANGI